MTRPTNPRPERSTKVTGRKKRTIIEETIPDSAVTEGDEISDFEVALESVEDEEKLREVLESFGETGVAFKIYQQTPTGPRFCFRSDSLDEEFIQSNYGGGDYIARIYISGKHKKSIPVKIADKVAGSNPSGNGDSHSGFLEKLVLAMIAKEHSAPQTQGQSITDLVTALAGIDQLRGKQETGLEMFMKGADFAKGMEGGEESWKSMLMRHAPQLLDTASTIAGNLVGGKPRPVTPPAPVAVATETPTENPPEVIPVEVTEANIIEGLKFMKSRLMAGMQPDTIINWVFDNRDQITYQPLIQQVLSKPFDYFVGLYAEIGQEPFLTSFRNVYDGLRSLFVEEYGMELDSGGSGGDPVDPRKDGGTSTNGNK